MIGKLTRYLTLPVMVKEGSINAILFFIFFSSLSMSWARGDNPPNAKGEEHPIVVPFPTRTIADRVLEANTIVLAKEAADKPYTYAAHTAMKGSLSDAEEIDLFMNSSIRRILKTFPERSMVLIRLGDGEAQTWETVGGPHPEMESLVNEILKNADNWEKNPNARLDFFMEWVGHSNTAIHDLAYIEVGRAPYSEIRKMEGIIPSSEIHSFLRDVQYVEWQALYILLLGLSKDPYDQKMITDAFYNASRFGTDKRLAAWSTAYLEIKPKEAFAAIEEGYFRNPGRTLAEIKAVQAAVSAHGSEGHSYLRDEMVEAYKILLKNYPDLVTPVVKDLTQWQRWDLAGQVREIMQDLPSSTDYMSVLLLRKYVKAANAAAGQ